MCDTSAIFYFVHWRISDKNLVRLGHKNPWKIHVRTYLRGFTAESAPCGYALDESLDRGSLPDLVVNLPNFTIWHFSNNFRNNHIIMFLIIFWVVFYKKYCKKLKQILPTFTQKHFCVQKLSFLRTFSTRPTVFIFQFTLRLFFFIFKFNWSLSI